MNTLGEPYQCFTMCLNKIQDSEMENIPVNVQVAPFTKSFGYTKLYLYGESDQKIESKEIKYYVVNVPSPSDLASIVIRDINEIFDNEVNTYKEGYILRAAVAFIINHHSIPDHANDDDELDDTSTAEIPLYHIGKDRFALLNTELIQTECFHVFYSDEDDVSSDEDN